MPNAHGKRWLRKSAECATNAVCKTVGHILNSVKSAMSGNDFANPGYNHNVMSSRSSSAQTWHVDFVPYGAGDRILIAGVGMTHHAGGRIIPENASNLLAGLDRAVRDQSHARVLRIAHTNAAAVMERDPRRAARRVEQRIQDRPVGHGVRAVKHAFGFTHGGGHRTGVHMIAADHDGRL
jgi:hypothetical protein